MDMIAISLALYVDVLKVGPQHYFIVVRNIFLRIEIIFIHSFTTSDPSRDQHSFFLVTSVLLFMFCSGYVSSHCPTDYVIP